MTSPSSEALEAFPSHSLFTGADEPLGSKAQLDLGGHSGFQALPRSDPPSLALPPVIVLYQCRFVSNGPKEMVSLRLRQLVECRWITHSIRRTTRGGTVLMGSGSRPRCALQEGAIWEPRDAFHRSIRPGLVRNWPGRWSGRYERWKLQGAFAVRAGVTVEGSGRWSEGRGRGRCFRHHGEQRASMGGKILPTSPTRVAKRLKEPDPLWARRFSKGMWRGILGPPSSIGHPS